MRNTKFGPIRLDENGWRLCEQCGDYKVPWRDLPPKERNKESGKLSHHRTTTARIEPPPPNPWRASRARATEVLKARSVLKMKQS